MTKDERLGRMWAALHGKFADAMADAASEYKTAAFLASLQMYCLATGEADQSVVARSLRESYDELTNA